MGTLATAFVEIRPEDSKLGPELTKQTEKAGDQAGQNAGHHFGQAMKRAIAGAGLALAVGAAFVGVKALNFLKQANADASNLNETVSKAQNIYPKTQAALNAFASTSAAALGLSKQQALEGAAGFGNFFNQIGIGEKQSLKMSTALIKLSADLGSFDNADPAQVMEAFQSATRGEYDSLQRFIPTINAATVQTEALRLTHKKSAKDLTEADKALALYQLSLKGAGKAAGDYARTAEGQANATRTWKANLADIRAEIGTAVMPVVTQFINLLNAKFVPIIRSLWAQHGPQVIAFFQQVVTGVQALMSAFEEGDVTSDGFVGVMERIGVGLRNLGPTLKSVVADVKNWFASQSGQGGPSLGDQLADAGKSAQQLLPLVKDFISQLPSLNDLVSVAGTVLGFLADHTEELKDLMPLLVAGFVAYQAAQAAAHVAALVALPTKIAEVFVNRQLVASNRALVASRAASAAATVGETAATATNTAAQNVGILTRARAVVGMVAQRVAMFAVRAATIAWTAVQWLLNAALTANPIGLIILAIVALVAGIIYAYKHSETFRKIVQAAWAGIQAAAKVVVDWFVNTAWPFLQKVWQGIVAGVQWAWRLWTTYLNLVWSVTQTIIGAIVGWVRSRIEAIVAIIHTVVRIVAIVREAWSRTNAIILGKITEAVEWVRALPGRFVAALKNLGSALYGKGKDLIQGFIDGIRSMAGKVRDVLVGLLPGPLKKFADMLGLASPSKLFRKWGRWTGEGYELGVLDKVGDVDAAIARLAGFGRPPGPPSGFAYAGGAAAAAASGPSRPSRMHPDDIRALGKEIGSQMTRGLQAFNGVQGRRAELERRGGG